MQLCVITVTRLLIPPEALDPEHEVKTVLALPSKPKEENNDS